jgi:hypothetical protein
MSHVPSESCFGVSDNDRAPCAQRCSSISIAGVFLVAFVVIVGGCYFGLQRFPLFFASLSGFALHVEKPPRQVATIGQLVELKAKLTAVGGKDVEVVGARCPCGCLDITPIPTRIPAGSTQEVTILFDSSGRKPMEFQANIDLILGTSSAQVQIPMHVTLIQNVNDK